MGRARVGLLLAASVATLMAGCGSEPATPGAANSGPPAPTAPVGADGKPISSLCDLLTEQDFTELTGQTAKKPAASNATTTTTTATCDYGSNMKLNVQVGGSIDDATSAYQTALKAGGFKEVKKGAIGGVDESTYGTAAGSGVLNLRRLKLVVTIAVPGADGEVKLIQLAARVLSRANALGT